MSYPTTELPWARAFGRRCKHRLHRKTALAWGEARWGRCDLRRGHDGDCALEYGMWVLMFGGDPFRLHLEPTDLLVHMIADRLHGGGRW